MSNNRATIHYSWLIFPCEQVSVIVRWRVADVYSRVHESCDIITIRAAHPMAWKDTFGQAFSRKAHAQPQHENDPPARIFKPTDVKGISFDALGQRDEILRHRVSSMVDRLDDIRSLQDEFSDIMQPLAEIVSELPLARTRIAELEAGLSKERQALGVAREEGFDASRRLALLTGEVADLKSRAEASAAELQRYEDLTERQRNELRDKTQFVEEFERRLFAEQEHKEALQGENKSLRAEAQAADSTVARMQHDMLEARSRLEVLEQDNRRLQLLSEELSVELEDARERVQEFVANHEAEKAEAQTLREQLASEASERQRVTAQLDAESAAHRTERVNLNSKLEAANSRAMSTAQLLTQARNTLREKDESERAVNRELKAALLARGTADKRLDALQEDLGRQSSRSAEMERSRSELAARVDMLTKALAAKDASLDQAATRNQALSDRLEQLNARHEANRSELELANRRLTEDLENERSERALAQGALDIARESRANLQKQYDAFKRSSRAWRDIETESAEDDSTGEIKEISNVKKFVPTGKSKK